MDDTKCPNCGGPAQLLPKFGDREDWECARCYPFSISGTDKVAFRSGSRGALVKDEANRVWLKPTV